MKVYPHYSEFPMIEWRWKDFSPREIASKREGELGIDAGAMDKLQALRTRLGRPVTLTSAYRSPAHNRAVGGARSSYHMQGRAFDVNMANHDPHEFEQAAREVGFTGFGHYVDHGFMHIDDREAPLVFRGRVSDWPVTATSLTMEASKPLRQDRQAVAVAGAGASGALAFGVEHIPAASGLLGSLAPVAQTVAVVATMALLAYLLWRRSRA